MLNDDFGPARRLISGMLMTVVANPLVGCLATVGECTINRAPKDGTSELRWGRINVTLATTSGERS